MFRAVPVGRFFKGTTFKTEHFKQGQILHEGRFNPAGDFRQRHFESVQKFQVGDEQIVNLRNPYLRHHRIFAGSEEAFDFKVLLHPFEKELNLPALFVNSCY